MNIGNRSSFRPSSRGARLGALPVDLLHRVMMRAAEPGGAGDVVQLAAVSRTFRDAVRTYPWSGREYPRWLVHRMPPREDAPLEERRRAWFALIVDWHARTQTRGAWPVPELLTSVVPVPPTVLLHGYSMVPYHELNLRHLGDIARALSRSHRVGEARCVEGWVSWARRLGQAVAQDRVDRVHELTLHMRPSWLTHGIAQDIGRQVGAARRQALASPAPPAAVDVLKDAMVERLGLVPTWQLLATVPSLELSVPAFLDLWGALPSVSPLELQQALVHASARGCPEVVAALVERAGPQAVAWTLSRLLGDRQANAPAPAFLQHFPRALSPGSLFRELWAEPRVLTWMDRAHRSGADFVLAQLACLGERRRGLGHALDPAGRHLTAFVDLYTRVAPPGAAERMMFATLSGLRVKNKSGLRVCEAFARTFGQVGLRLPAPSVLGALPSVVGGAWPPRTSFATFRKMDLGRAEEAVSYLHHHGCLNRFSRPSDAAEVLARLRFPSAGFPECHQRLVALVTLPVAQP